MSVKITHEEKFEDGVKVKEYYYIYEGIGNSIILNVEQFNQLKEQIKRYE